MNLKAPCLIVVLHSLIIILKIYCLCIIINKLYEKDISFERDRFWVRLFQDVMTRLWVELGIRWNYLEIFETGGLVSAYTLFCHIRVFIEIVNCLETIIMLFYWCILWIITNNGIVFNKDHTQLMFTVHFAFQIKVSFYIYNCIELFYFFSHYTILIKK